jgi:hypothetical protein
MKMGKIVCLFFLVAGISVAQDTLNIPDYFYKRLEGKINGNLNIQMNLTRMDSVLDGNYFYESKGEPIYFQYYSHIKEGDKVHIEEEGGYDEEYNTIITGIFDGSFVSQNKIKGIWLKPDSSEYFNFYLEENYPVGSTKFNLKNLNRNYGESDFSDYAVSIDLTYPVMTGYPDEEVQQKINTYIMDFYLSGSMEGDSTFSDIDDRADSFIEDYKQEVEEDSGLYNDYKPVYENNEFTSISFNSDNILSLEIIEYIFTGGAHGNSSFALSSFNLETGEQIKLDDIFSGDYKSELDGVGEKIFREHYQADSTQSLYDQGFFGFENGFALNDNFDLYKNGIKFQFNPYEAGAYVLGAPEVFIPYSEIRNIIRNDSVLGRMLNK